MSSLLLHSSIRTANPTKGCRANCFHQMTEDKTCKIPACFESDLLPHGFQIFGPMSKRVKMEQTLCILIQSKTASL